MMLAYVVLEGGLLLITKEFVQSEGHTMKQSRGAARATPNYEQQ